MNAYLTGLAISASLIIAIGAQNAFVLTQGMRRRYYLAIPLVCSLSDALLILTGVLGVGELLSSRPLLTIIGTMGGTVFLFLYGINRFRSFQNPIPPQERNDGPQSLQSALLLTLAVTWLNPHVYLDTLILLGGVSSRYSGRDRLLFGSGAATLSFLWFFSLSLGGRLLSPLFENPRFGKALDLIMALIMWSLAVSLGSELIGGF